MPGDDFDINLVRSMNRVLTKEVSDLRHEKAKLVEWLEEANQELEKLKEKVTGLEALLFLSRKE